MDLVPRESTQPFDLSEPRKGRKRPPAGSTHETRTEAPKPKRQKRTQSQNPRLQKKAVKIAPPQSLPAKRLIKVPKRMDGTGGGIIVRT